MCWNYSWAVLILSLAAAAGCSQQTYDGDLRVPVRGKVTLDGKPLPSGVLNLQPQSGGRVAYGEIVAGTYTIEEAMGPNVGSYTIAIYSYKPIPGAKENESGDIPTEQIIPKKYNKETELTVEFEPGANEHDFALTSK